MNSKEINKFVLAVLFCFFTMNTALPQVAINTNGAQPDSKSILDVASTTLGVLLPRMTEAQRTAITSPPQGLLVFQIDGGVNAGLYYATGEGNNWTLIFHSNTTAITGTGSQNYIPYWTGTNALAFTGMYWDNTNGRLGIGTTSPQAKLQVDGYVFINNAAAPGFYGQSAGTNKVYLGYDGAGTGLELYNFQSTKSLKIQDDGYLTYLGNVGIGTTTPVSALQLGSLTSISTIVNNQSLFGNNMYYTGGQTGPGVWKYITTAPASAMRLWDDGSIRFHTVASGTAEATINIADMDTNGVKMIIQNGGNVGIGTTTPAEKLDINGNIRIPNNSSFVGASGSGDNFAYNNGTFNGNLPRYSISWVNISSTAEAILSSVGGIKLLIGAANTGAYVDGTGVHSYSDVRLKHNVVPMSNMLEKVLQMQGVTFNLNANNQASFGFIAQDLEKVFPLAVNTGADSYKSVNYAAMTSVLVEAVKDLNAKVEKSEKENTNLKSEMEQMKSDIQQLKSGNVPSYAGFGGNTLVVLLSIIGIALGVVLYRKVSK